jgi:hypothetical protein
MRSCGTRSCGGEKAEGFCKRDSEKKKTRHQRRNRYGYPHLLTALFDGLHKVSMDFGANGASFLGNEMPEVAGITVQREDTNEPSDCGHIGGSGPFSKRGVFIDSMLNTGKDSLEILCDGSG